MFEKTFTKSVRYRVFIAVVLVFIGIGFAYYLKQLTGGLTITGMNRDVSWGLYIGQLTFFEGVAGSVVLVVLLYYLHDCGTFWRMAVLGEFLAVTAVILCFLFIIIDLGKPERAFQIIMHPTPGSVLFWDMVVLTGAFFLNVIIGRNILLSHAESRPRPFWIKTFICLALLFAVSFFGVTALMYTGLPGRSFWQSIMTVPRLIISALAVGPAILIILALIVKRVADFDAGEKAIQNLRKLVLYAMGVHLFFLLLEIVFLFRVWTPENMHHMVFLDTALNGYEELVSLIYASIVSSALAFLLLLHPISQRRESALAVACLFVFLSLWIEKGFFFIVGGFVPSPLGGMLEYWPTKPEVFITLGILAVGALLLSVFYTGVSSVEKKRWPER